MWRGIFSRRDPLDTVEKVDRQRFYQNYRLVAGCYVDDQLTRVEGSLLLVQGAGRWLRCRPLFSAAQDIPAATAKLAGQIAVRPAAMDGTAPRSEEVPCLIDPVALRDVQADLSECIVSLIHKMQKIIGNSANRVLACGITHESELSDCGSSQTHGLNHHRLFDYDWVAEKCGLSLVSQFCFRDQAAGGTGRCIGALPLWLLLADRRDPEATDNRILVFNSQSVLGLPASDGIDDAFPDILWLGTATSSSGLSKPMLEKFVERCRSHWGAVQTAITCHDAQQPDIDDWFRGMGIRLTHVKAISDFASWNLETGPGFPNANESDRFSAAASAGAVLALMHLDQMPANLPALTGASAPRILGQITPGSPANWRSVLLNMADYRPPAMRLKDAI